MKHVSRKKRGKNSRISAKIKVLRDEGKDAEQAAGMAYGMEREGRLRSGGRYIRSRKSRRRMRS